MRLSPYRDPDQLDRQEALVAAIVLLICMVLIPLAVVLGPELLHHVPKRHI